MYKMEYYFIVWFSLVLGYSSCQVLKNILYQGQCSSKLNTVSMSLQDISQPLYVRLTPDDLLFRSVDNLCVTTFPIDKSNTTYIFYAVTVFVNGTSATTKTIAKNCGKGTLLRSNFMGTITQRFLSNFRDSNTTLACTNLEFGLNPSPSVFVTSFNKTPFTEDMISEAEQNFKSLGLDRGPLYQLPMKLPTACVLKRGSISIFSLLPSFSSVES